MDGLENENDPKILQQTASRSIIEAEAQKMVTLHLDDQLESLLHLTNQPVETAAREMIVLELYRRELISSGKAAELLSMDRMEFIRFSSKLGIPFFDMSEDELRSDLETLRNLG